MKRILTFGLIIAMLAGMFVAPVSADVTEVAPDARFSSVDKTPAEMYELVSNGDLLYTHAKGTVPTGTQIEGTNWRFRNAAESPDGVGNSGDSGTITYGVVKSGSNGYLSLKARSSSAVGAIDASYVNEANKVPALVYTQDLTGLSSNQKINVDILKDHAVVTSGIRFMVHNNGKDYYALTIAGQYSPGTNGLQLFKSVDGVVTSLATFDFDYASHNAATGETKNKDSFRTIVGAFTGVEITVCNGTIDVTAVGPDKMTVSGSYTDSEPFNVSGNDSGVWLMAYNAGGNDTRYAKFRNFSIRSYDPFIHFQPLNVMFVDAAEGKTADADGVIDLGKAVPVRKVVYSGDVEDQDVLVSKDNLTWYKLTNVNGFKDGIWTNLNTNTAYRFVKAGRITDDIKFLTDVTEISTMVAENPITLYPRINDVDEFGTATLSSSAPSVVGINNSTISPMGKGQATITATSGSNSISVVVNVTSTEIFSYVDDISGASAQTLTELGAKIEGTNWRMRNAAETPDGLEKHPDGNVVEFGKKSNYLFIEAPYTADTSHNESQAAKVPALVLDNVPPELEHDHKISYQFTKSHTTVSTGVRFMVHNNGLNYYALILGGLYYRNDTANRGWELLKFTNGKIQILKQGGSKDYSGYATLNGNAYDNWNVDITVSGNDITFKVTKDNDRTVSFGGSYTDEAMFDVTGKDLGVWLMAANGNNSERHATFKNFKMENYPPYLSGYEPSKVIYIDAAEGKEVTNGVIDLGANYVVRKVVANGSGTAYVSKDGNNWFTLGELSNGSVLNTFSDSAMRYVKVEGAATDIKALAEITGNRLALAVREERTLYPYFNGVTSSDIQIESTSSSVSVSGHKIKGVADEDGVVLKAYDPATGTPVEIVVDVALVSTSKFVASDSDDVTKWNVNVTALGIKGTSNTVLVVFYNADGSLMGAQVFANTQFDANGNAVVKAKKVELSAGAYGIGYIWNNLTDVKPVTTSSTIEF